MSFAATIVLLFLIGYASQRGGVCMVQAMREVIEQQSAHLLAGFALAAASAMVVMGLAELSGAKPFATILGAPADPIAVVGGVLFGLGSLLPGHCAMGLLAGFTRGEVWRIASIAAMLLSALLVGPGMMNAAVMLPPRASVSSPLTGNLFVALALGSTVGFFACAYIYRQIGWRRAPGGWSLVVAMSLIGTASGILFALDRQWLYTSRIAAIAYGSDGLTLPILAGLAAVVSGMTIASMTGKSFRLSAGNCDDWLKAAGGGVLMGIGATLVPGGNDAMLFTGVPLLLPNLLTGYASFAITLLVALYIRRQAAPRSS